ncbi:MAG: hypothetical protein ACJA0W_004232 [Candidatus Azotimanducaceae bacterium]|jgi:hypothetical protein
MTFPERKPQLFTPLQRSLISGVAGFIVYGGWGFWVNMSHGTEMGVMAGLIQGSYSFVLTLSMTIVMEYLMRMLAGFPGRQVITVGMVSVGTFAVAYSIQWLNSTPEILLTIIPGFLIGAVYSGVYVAGLSALDVMQDAKTASAAKSVGE